MNKKWIVSIIIIAVILLMILDFKYNNIRIIENLYRELETDSLRNLIEGNTVGSYHGASAELEFTDQIINIGDEIKELYIDNAIGSIEIRGKIERISCFHISSQFMRKMKSWRSLLSGNCLFLRIPAGKG